MEGLDLADQNQNTYYENMNEAYIKKHYPEGSVFKAFKKTNKGARAYFTLLIMAGFTAGCLAVFIWSANRTLEMFRDGEEGLGIGIGISIVILLFALVFGFVIFIAVKDMTRTVDDWIRLTAKKGACSEQELREFDKQAMEPDSLILNHLGKLKSFTVGQKSGILTRDYICLYGNAAPQILKLDTLTEAFLKDNSYYVKVGNKSKLAHYLTINLANNKNNKSAWAETSLESGRALQALLKDRCPGIDTAGGDVLK